MPSSRSGMVEMDFLVNCGSYLNECEGQNSSESNLGLKIGLTEVEIPPNLIVGVPTARITRKVMAENVPELLSQLGVKIRAPLNCWECVE